MRKNLYKLSIIFTFGLLFNSCVRYKNYVLFNDTLHGSHDTSKTLIPEDYKLQVADLINITATSTDQQSITIFLKNASGGTNAVAQESTLFLSGYSVSDSGNISLPVIGDVHVLNKTTEEVRNVLQEKLSLYFKYAVVDVKLVSFRVSFLGEFSNVGTQTVYRKQLNLIEALSLGGGFTDFSKRNAVKLMREIDGKMVVKKIDFTDPNIINHDWFYLQPNDILYAEPLRIKPLKTNASTLSLVISAVSFVILLVNFSRN